MRSKRKEWSFSSPNEYKNPPTECFSQLKGVGGGGAYSRHWHYPVTPMTQLYCTCKVFYDNSW